MLEGAIQFAVPIVTLILGVLFSQKIKDWFSGVESDIRAKANGAALAVVTAAKNEASKAASAAHAAADNVLAQAQAAVAPVAPLPTPPAA